jgi:hypothetical protein
MRLRTLSRWFLPATLVAAIALLVAPAAQAQEPHDFTLSTALCPVCTSSQLAAWSFVNDNQLRIGGRDPVGPWTGSWPAERYYYINNWFPQAFSKRTMCGVLDHFNFYDGAGDEADWNNFTRPDPAFQYVINDVAARYGTTSEWHTDSSGRRLMETEITPDEHFYENPWFPKSTGESPLEGRKLCTSGPWVAEKLHDYRPEIHPAEQYWWRSGTSGYLLLLQEDSNRFDRRDDYDFDGDPTPSWWRPWSRYPRTGTFSLAFRLSPTRGAASVTINEDAVRNSVLFDSSDVDDGASHALVYNGRTLLRVVEQVTDNRVKVGFTGLCRDAANTALYGYTTLTSKVGSGDRGDEGYHLLRFSESPQPSTVLPVFPSVEPAEVAPVLLRATVQRDSVRTLSVDGRRMLVGDVTLRSVATQRSRSRDLTFARRELLGGRRIRQPSLHAGARSVQLTVPLTRAARARVRTASGRIASLALPQVGAAPDVTGFETSLVPSAPDLWPLLARAAGGEGIGPPPIAPQRVERIRLRAVQSYATIRNGRASREDESPFEEALDAALKNSRKSRVVFGSARPATLAWSFSARDAVQNRAVRVVLNGTPGPGEIGVTTSRTRIGSTADVAFPSGLYELTGRVTMRDRLGNSGSAEVTVSSAVLADRDKGRLTSGLLAVAAMLAGAAPQELVALAQAEPSGDQDVLVDRRLELAQTVRSIVDDIALDRRVTLDELRTLVRAGRLFAAAPPRQ